MQSLCKAAGPPHSFVHSTTSRAVDCTRAFNHHGPWSINFTYKLGAGDPHYINIIPDWSVSGSSHIAPEMRSIAYPRNHDFPKIDLCLGPPTLPCQCPCLPISFCISPTAKTGKWSQTCTGVAIAIWPNHWYLREHRG